MPSGSLIFQFSGTTVISPGGSIPLLGTKTFKSGEVKVVGIRSKNSISNYFNYLGSNKSSRMDPLSLIYYSLEKYFYLRL